MGFRSTFVSEDTDTLWPEWFRTKYAGIIYFNQDFRGPVASRAEYKTYGLIGDLPADIQKVLIEENKDNNLTVVYLHECEGVTRCVISQESINWSEPVTWKATSGITHIYCYGCSDV